MLLLPGECYFSDPALRVLVFQFCHWDCCQSIICSISIAFYWPETNFFSWINLSLSVSANWLQLSSVWVPSAYYPFSWPLIIFYPLLCLIDLISFSLYIKTTERCVERLIKHNINPQTGKQIFLLSLNNHHKFCFLTPWVWSNLRERKKCYVVINLTSFISENMH